ncbi:14137_t:CDS:2 [Ambispora leptoticha]|uniref:14137_t:CDS:1 n=1 Tax=Ambispora leptoticha TaxID=144679 RepID=A0A9N9GIJ0_9GLOM|nr:14137_t:CDS:2 [Ambispora leptoticha]
MTLPQYYSTDNNNNHNTLMEHHNSLLEGLQQQTQFDFVTSAGHVELMPEPPPYEQFNIEWPSIPIPIPADPPEFMLGGGQQQLFEPEEQSFLFDKFVQYFDVDPGNQNFMLTPEMQFYPSQSPSNGTTNNHLIADGSTSVSVVDTNSSSSSHIYGGNGITNLDAFLSSNSTSLSPRTQNLQLTTSPKSQSSPDFSNNNTNDTNPITTNTSINNNSSNGGNGNLNRKRKQAEDEDQRSTRRFSHPRVSPINTKSASSVRNGQSTNISRPRFTPPTPNRDLPQKVESSSRKPYKELLTEEEKRANHIASEQKRRNTIRAGFKELTDIIPTLKNVNNSKSTVLFKAVDYIRYLERRNRNLKERANLLEMRVEMEIRSGRSIHHPSAYGFGHPRMPSMPFSHVSPTYGIIPGNMSPTLITGHPAQHVMGGPATASTPSQFYELHHQPMATDAKIAMPMTSNADDNELLHHHHHLSQLHHHAPNGAKSRSLRESGNDLETKMKQLAQKQ